MEIFLLFFLLIFALYFIFHLVCQKLQNKIYYIPGIEFFFIGILINGSFIEYINQNFGISLPFLLKGDGSSQINLLITVTIGIVGFSAGLQFRIKDLFNFSIEHFKLSLTNILFTILAMSVITFLILNNLYKDLIPLGELILITMIVGVAASTLSISVIESTKNKFNIDGKNFQTLYLLPKPNNFLSISIFGLIFVLAHHTSTNGFRITPVEWFVLSIIIGILLGFLFFIFLGREKEESKLLLAISGILIFLSGLSFYLNVSPLFLSLIAGFVIGNLIQSKEILSGILEKLELPVNAVILIYSGALIKIDNFLFFFSGLFLFLLSRLLIKYFTGWFSYQISIDKSKFSNSIGKGLNSQGIIAIAMMINFQQVYNNPVMNLIFSIVVIAILINEILSAKLLKDLLIDLNEIK